MSESALDGAVFSFERVLPELGELPIAARRALDHAGLRLSLEAWRSLSTEARRRIVIAGAADRVDVGAVALATRRAHPAPQGIEPVADPDPNLPPPTLVQGLAPSRALDVRTWVRLRALDRYALAHEHRRAVARGDRDRLPAAYDAIVTRSSVPPPGRSKSSAPPPPPVLAKSEPPPRMLELDVGAVPAAEPPISTHVGPGGEVRMVNVGAKPITLRRAVATGTVRMQEATLARLARHDVPKGEVLATARIAGIQAAKKTSELIPLCHTIPLDDVTVLLELDGPGRCVRVTAIAEAQGRTGVEMEALTAVSVACLTIYDMLKGVDRDMVISEVTLLEKSGGRTGHYRRGAP